MVSPTAGGRVERELSGVKHPPRSVALGSLRSLSECLFLYLNNGDAVAYPKEAEKIKHDHWACGGPLLTGIPGTTLELGLGPALLGPGDSS